MSQLTRDSGMGPSVGCQSKGAVITLMSRLHAPPPTGDQMIRRLTLSTLGVTSVRHIGQVVAFVNHRSIQGE